MVSQSQYTVVIHSYKVISQRNNIEFMEFNRTRIVRNSLALNENMNTELSSNATKNDFSFSGTNQLCILHFPLLG